MEDLKEEKVVEEKTIDDRMDIYSKEIEVPSNGYLGGPKSIVIRAMTAAEEKVLYSSKDFSFIKKIVRACTTSPKDLDMNTLMPEDLVYILYRIRELTFGPTYEQPIKCPECGLEQNAEINIAGFKYNLLDEEEVDGKLSIVLPILKARAKLKLISKGEIDSLEKEVLRIATKEEIKDVDGFFFIKRLMASVEDIEGVDFENDKEKLIFFNKLHALDVNAIRNAIDGIVFGLVTDTIVTCKNKNCEGEVEVVGTLCPEFFRPTK